MYIGDLVAIDMDWMGKSVIFYYEFNSLRYTGTFTSVVFQIFGVWTKYNYLAQIQYYKGEHLKYNSSVTLIVIQ